MEDALIVKQVEVLLDIQTKKLQAQLGELKEELSRVQQSLRTQEVRQKDPPASPSVAEPVAQPSAPPVEFQPKAVEQPAAAEPIDRNGVAPEDVAIEKIFYTGGQ